MGVDRNRLCRMQAAWRGSGMSGYIYGLEQDGTRVGRWLSGSKMFHLTQPDLEWEGGSIIWLPWTGDGRTIAMSGKGDAYAPKLIWA
jgi:hypothetical protein